MTTSAALSPSAGSDGAPAETTDQPTDPPRSVWRSLLIGLSLVNLLYVPLWGILQRVDTPDAFYLSLGRVDYLVALTTVVLLGSAVGALDWWTRARRGLARNAYRALLFGVTLVALNSLRIAGGVSAGAIARALGVRAGGEQVALAAVLIAILAAAFIVRASLERVLRQALLAMTAFVALSVSYSAYLALTTDFSRFDSQRSVRSPAGRPAERRVVVVVFDGLDQRALDQTRPKDLALPTFDRVVREGMSYQRAFAPGTNTLTSVLSYLYGQPVTSVRPTGARDMAVRIGGGAEQRGESAAPFVRQLFDSGHDMALIGTHLPYCRFAFSTLLSGCTLVIKEFGAMPTGERPGVISIAWGQLMLAFPWGSRVAAISRYEAVLAAASRVIADPQLELGILHVPVPHPPPIYRRTTGTFTPFSWKRQGYYDNLALADNALSRLLQSLQNSSARDRSTVIITADHGWRLPGDSAGMPHRHVPFMVWGPGITAGQSADSVSTLMLKDVVLGVLNPSSQGAIEPARRREPRSAR